MRRYLVLVGGLPAAGKSSVVAEVSRLAALLSKDDEGLAGIGCRPLQVLVIEADDCLREALAEQPPCCCELAATSPSASSSDNLLERVRVAPQPSSVCGGSSAPRSAVFARSRQLFRRRVANALQHGQSEGVESMGVSDGDLLVVAVDNFQLRGMRMELWRLCRDCNCNAARGLSVTNAATKWQFGEVLCEAPLVEVLARNDARGGIATPTGASGSQVRITADTILRMHATFDHGRLSLRHEVPRLVLGVNGPTTVRESALEVLKFVLGLRYVPACNCEKCSPSKSSCDTVNESSDTLLHRIDTELRRVVAEVMGRLHAGSQAQCGRQVSLVKGQVLREAKDELTGMGTPYPADEEEIRVMEYCERLRERLHGQGR